MTNNKMSVRPAKTQISLGICPVWSESSLCTQWVAKVPSFLHADSEDWSDWADAQAHLSLRWAHTHFVGFVMWWLICCGYSLDPQHMGRAKRFWYLSPMRAAKVQTSLCICAVSPEPPLLAHTSSESRGTFRQKARSLATLNGWACAVKICHDGMLEDTNSLDGARMFLWRHNETYSWIILIYPPYLFYWEEIKLCGYLDMILHEYSLRCYPFQTFSRMK